MSGTRSVPFGKDLPPPLVPLPSCHARVKQLQARLFNGVPLSTSYIANCRLCLGSNFGEKSTTIIEERLCTMLKHVFPFPINNQIGLPMNVCTECYKSVQIFYGYSHQVQINQQKLQESLVKAECLDYTEINNAVLKRTKYPGVKQEKIESGIRERLYVGSEESQKNYEKKLLIDTDVQSKTEVDEAHQGENPPSQPPCDDEKPLRTAAKVGSVSTIEAAKGNTRTGLSLVECKRNANGNDTKDKNAESSPIALSCARKKTRYSSDESNCKTFEQNATDLANRLELKPMLNVCCTCKQRFDKHDQLLYHQKTHLMKECPICNQSIQYTLLAKHVIKEHAERDRWEKKTK
ncbi:uncharacterized protein LOC128712750 [Anopheles marshallii]|uniref:uncharacterized protein LOC128712750 n=1 Tax=Anopheles marshallii TaxID=1521116 RepID=UPI00237BDD4D|nr:uncharacterized protein LOC128712750 [Anopheles marshallii]